jgi:hypothetical protein
MRTLIAAFLLAVFSAAQPALAQQSLACQLGEAILRRCQASEAEARALVEARDNGTSKATAVAVVRGGMEAHRNSQTAHAEADLAADADFVYGGLLSADAAGNEVFRACLSGDLP